MISFRISLLTAAAAIASVASLAAQGLDPSLLKQQPMKSWPTYNGDYSGRRYQPARRRSSRRTCKISRWPGLRAFQRERRHRHTTIKSTPLLVNDVLYLHRAE